MAFPVNLATKIRSQISISSVIAKKVKLKKKGKDFLGLCPFHQEKTPSFTVNDAKGLYYCFGCGAGGDVVKFVSETEKITYGEAIKKIAYDFNLELPKNHKTNHLLPRKYLILNTILQFFKQNLQNNLSAQQYLISRGLNEATINFFQLGFANNSYSDLVDLLLKQNFSTAEILETGIFGHKDNKIFNKFRQRIIFPIYNHQQQVISFGGRCLDGSLPKYLNSAETNFFKKSQILYNFACAKKNINTLDFALLVEGYIDVISLHQYGFLNTVSGLGTAISEHHLQQLFGITNKVISCLDGDQAGIRAGRRLVDISLPLIDNNKSLSFVFLPNKLDPDDFLKLHGKENFQNLLNNSVNLSQVVFDFALQDLGIDKHQIKISAEQKINLEEFLKQKLNLIKNISCKKHFANFFREQLFLLGRNTKYYHKNLEKKPEKTLEKTSLPILIFNQHENILLSILAFIIKFPNLIDYTDENFNFRELTLQHSRLDDFKDFIINYCDENNENRQLFELLITRITNSEFSIYLNELQNKMHQPACNQHHLEKKLQILLLKNLVLHVENQYQQATKHANFGFVQLQELLRYKTDISRQIQQLEQHIFEDDK